MLDVLGVSSAVDFAQHTCPPPPRAPFSSERRSAGRAIAAAYKREPCPFPAL